MSSQNASELGLGQETACPSNIYNVSDRDDGVINTVVHYSVHMYWDTVLGEYLKVCVGGGEAISSVIKEGCSVMECGDMCWDVKCVKTCSVKMCVCDV